MGEIQMNNSKEDKNNWAIKACLDPAHNPPSHIYVPPGQTFKHECPRCGQRTEIHGKHIWM